MDNLDQNESGTEPQGNAPANQDDHALLLQILAELRLLSDRISAATTFQKPILKMDEAARLPRR
jgi:hypothetical protein